MLGMWIWPGSIQKYGADQTVERCKKAGVTDLFFLVKGLSGKAAFLSALAPAADERDLLQELLEAAHQQGIRVHAWFTSACDEHYKQLHPQSGRYHFRRGRDRELISLRDEGYLAYMEQITADLCRRYDVDGLHLDYIRYNHLLYGWDDEDLRHYASEGADPEGLCRTMQQMFYGEPAQENLLFDLWREGDANALALAQARRKDVVRFAERLIQAAKSEKQGLILSAALMPEGAYDDIAFSDLHYGQNYEDAAKLFEYALPMAYSKAYGQDAQWVHKVAVGTMKKGFKTLVGLHAYEGGTGLSLKQDIEAVQNTGAEGICLFREGATALACMQGKQLWVCNALEDPITSIAVSCGSEKVQLQETIGSGCEANVVLPFLADTVQVFTGEQERCVYTRRIK